MLVILKLNMTARRHRARQSSPLNLPSALELFADSIIIVKKNIWIFGPLAVFPLLFSFHSWEWTPAIGSANGHWWTTYSWFGSGFSTTGVPSYLWYPFIGFSLLWFVFVLAAGTLIQVMSQQAQLEASENKSLNFAKLWAVAKEMGWKMFKLYLVMALYITVGLILFIIPGLIMLRRYFFAPYIMLETKCSVKDAMERSAAMTKPFSGAVWGVIGIMVVISLLNAFPFIGWMLAFVAGMFYSVAPALRYQELKKVTS
jgi:hypothetical protein